MVKQRLPAEENILCGLRRFDTRAAAAAAAAAAAVGLSRSAGTRRPQRRVMAPLERSRGVALDPVCRSFFKTQRCCKSHRSMESVRAHTPSVHKCPQSRSARNLQRETRLRRLALIGAAHLSINPRDYLFRASRGEETRARQLMAHRAPRCPVSVKGNNVPVGLPVQNPESSDVNERRCHSFRWRRAPVAAARSHPGLDSGTGNYV